MDIQYHLARSDFELKRATEGSSGYDVLADIESSILLLPGSRQLINTGLTLKISRGAEAQIRSRSGLSSKHAVVVLNSPATIDSDYRGEVKVLLANLGSECYTVEPGHKIAQIVFAPVLPDFLDHVYHGDSVCWVPRRVDQKIEPDTFRGVGGFGSTGR